MIREHEKKFLEFLSLPSSYDYDPEFVEVVQTHISIVAIAPPYVFKIKKNVKLDFLDYSSLEKRKFYLEREIELNRRLCDGVYLDIVPIYEFEGLLSFEPFFHGSGRIYDYALKMNYLRPQFCLANILQKRVPGRGEVDALVQRLMKFYDMQRHDNISEKLRQEVSENGRPGAVYRLVHQNLVELQNVSNGILPAGSFCLLESFLKKFFDRHEPDFQARYASGFIRDCHGDLRLDHIFIQNENVCIYDCIEFNDSFRHIDIVNDLAFFLMELDFNAYAETSNLFKELFFRKPGQWINDLPGEAGESLLPFYKIHRALVRAKVNCILSREEEIAPGKRAAAAQNAERFLALAVKYALTLDRPSVFVVMGKTASGKSTVAKKLSHDAGVKVVSTDVTRKHLARIEPMRETPAGLKATIYSSQFTEEVYQAVISKAETILHEDNAVILDGTFGKKKYRQLLREKFSNARLVFIELHSGDSEKIERLKSRVQTGDVSDARVADKETIDELYEPVDEIPDAMKISVKNSGDICDVKKSLYEQLFEKYLVR